MNTAQTLTRARRNVGSGKRFALDRGEPLRDLVPERARVVDEFVGKGTCSLEKRTVVPQLREPQIGQSRLPRSEQLSAAAQVEVDFRELESVCRSHERLE